jgi:hypothetical protein
LICAGPVLTLYLILHLFFQASINQGILPTDWKTANVVPIFKKGNKSKAENYRPVSLTSEVSKMMEHIIWNILKDIKSYTMLNMAFGSDAQGNWLSTG